MVYIGWGIINKKNWKVRWLYINKLKNYNKSIFENIKHIDDNGNEFWLARELSKALDIKTGKIFKES